MRIEQVEIDSLQPHPKNPRRGLVSAIAESIEANGFYGGVVAQVSTRFILIGNHRWKAAREKGMSYIPTIWVDVDDDRAIKILLADNRASDMATYSKEVLGSILRGYIEDNVSLAGTGYSESDAKLIVKELNELYRDAALKPEDAGGPGASMDPEDTRETILKIGDLNVPISVKSWHALKDNLYITAGHSREKVIVEIRRRLKL